MAALGLGCSRFGSLVGGTDRARAETLIATARDIGVRHFDTADIYGQGDSERFLGHLLRSMPDARITTKAGQRFPMKKRLLLKVKPILRPMLARSGKASGAANRSRAGLLPQDWRESHLRSALEGSLKRLRREAVDEFLLHSPPADVLLRGDAMRVLEGLQASGKARRIGVSIDDASAFAAALSDDRIQAIQLPLTVLNADAGRAAQAAAKGVRIIVREIFAAAGSHDPGQAMARVPGMVDVVLVGTANPAHLREAGEALAGAAPC